MPNSEQVLISELHLIMCGFTVGYHWSWLHSQRHCYYGRVHVVYTDINKRCLL